MEWDDDIESCFCHASSFLCSFSFYRVMRVSSCRHCRCKSESVTDCNDQVSWERKLFRWTKPNLGDGRVHFCWCRSRILLKDSLLSRNKEGKRGSQLSSQWYIPTQETALTLLWYRTLSLPRVINIERRERNLRRVSCMTLHTHFAV